MVFRKKADTPDRAASRLRHAYVAALRLLGEEGTATVLERARQDYEFLAGLDRLPGGQ